MKGMMIENEGAFLCAKCSRIVNLPAIHELEYEAGIIYKSETEANRAGWIKYGHNNWICPKCAACENGNEAE